MIKKSFFSLKLALAWFLLFPLFLTHIQAAAPSSVAGWTFFVRIEEGGFGMGKEGSFLLCLDTNECRIVSLANIEDSVGAYSYGVTGAVGTVTMGSIAMSFVFTDDRRGDYGLVRGGTHTGGYQLGKFSAAGGTAPALTNAVLDFNGKRGDMPAVRVNYRLLTSAGNTYSKVIEGVPTASNAYGVQVLNRSTTRMFFNDAILGTGHSDLMFTTPSGGLFAYKIGSGKAYELGTFTLQAAATPRITKQPSDQMVVHGGTATFSVEVTGAQPMTYQWLRDDAPIPGATQARYSVSPVRATSAGIFKVRISNFLGLTTSQGALLTPLCPTSLNVNHAWFDYTGGTGSVEVINSECILNPIETNSWIHILNNEAPGLNTLHYSVALNTNSTPRTGNIRIGTQLLKVAQQGTFAPANLTGKTLRTDMDIGTEGSPTNITVFYATSPGTTNYFFLSTLEGANTNRFGYSYQKIDPTTAQVNFFSDETMLLTFSDFASGTFSLTNTNNLTSFEGPFVLSQRRGDVTFDGFPDLRWQNATGLLQVLYSDGQYTTNIVEGQFPPLVGVSDFSRDGKLDALYLTAQRVLAAVIGTSNAIAFRGGAKLSPDWRPVTTEDISGDNYPDVLFQHKDGRLAYWEIGGPTNYFNRAVTIRNGKPAATNWVAIGAADINGDRQQDIILMNQVTKKAAVWYFNNGEFINVGLLANSTNTLGSNWSIGAIADMDSDGQIDLLWQNKHTGVVRVWFLDGTNQIGEFDLDYPEPNPSMILNGPR